MSNVPLLLVEDDASFTAAVSALLEREGYNVTTAVNLAETRKHLAVYSPMVTIIDLNLPDGNGLDLLEEFSGRLGRVVVITGNATLDSAIKSIQARVDDFLLKPIEMSALRSCLESLALTNRDKAVTESPQERVGRAFIGESSAINDIRKLVETVAKSDFNVLIQGETGTGKEVVARLIHDLSPRRDRPFVGINCGAMARELLESELFGHEKGSFTGATRQHHGHFERAAGGTLLLDELTEMPADLQVALLRVLEEGTYRRVGGEREMKTDVRILAASNRNMSEAVTSGRLREDLYYRLSVFPVVIPPLRQRRSDIELIAKHVLDELNQRHNTDKRLTEAAIERLKAYAWPGNVRELRNVLQRGFLLSDEVLAPEHVDIGDSPIGKSALDSVEAAAGLPWKDVERRLIEATLEKFANDKTQAAEALGISLKTLYNRLNAYEEEDKCASQS